jgi:MFS family permease
MTPRRGDRDGLVIVCTLVVLTFVTQSAVLPLVPLLSVSLGASPLLIGGLIAAGNFVPLVLAISLGRMVDRRGAWPLLVAGTAMLAIGAGIVALVPELVVLAVAQAIGGLGQIVLAVATQTTVAAIGVGRARQRAFGWYTAAVSFGQLLGPLAAGLIVDLAGFREAFAFAAAASCVALGLCFVLPRLGAPHAASPTGGVGGGVAPVASRVTAKALLSNWGMRMALVTSGGVVFAAMAYQSFLPVHLAELAFPATTVGAIISVRALAAVLVRPWLSSIATLFGSRSTAFVVLVTVVAVAVTPTAFVSSTWVLVVLALLVGVGTGIVPPLSMVTLVDHVAREDQGLAFGVRLTSNRVAHLLSPIVVGGAAQAFGLATALLLAGVLTAACAVVAACWRHPFETREQGLEAAADAVEAARAAE